ncbi:HNH endonuclease [Methanoregula boonei 6A8]|jgi:hypothetical protein|uniref:HNH endonuclease n=1 Tax=Methanoregula boonei (strain DSM 21154 / JCM 14090 / 6A8) TaxID=456442 RepID=A7I879_METB6|nr:HNH endonuclease signature motif containing protein [Methanoregula boonei]ABS55940.1 HNH endonuclease [Methanoregula boonei 6A8]
MIKKKRTEIPADISAKVLFDSNRTCCVCRNDSKQVIIHHLDENPSNNKLDNLAVLCLECHGKTHTRGGFDRKLDADQIKLYREDWLRLVLQQRAIFTLEDTEPPFATGELELITSQAEIFKEHRQYVLLAGLYHSINNLELRDKYIELALKKKQPDSTIIWLRCLQNKQELIPEAVLKRNFDTYLKNKDYLQMGRLNYDLKRFDQAAIDYIDGIHHAIHQYDSAFTAAFYLKEFVEKNLIETLFIKAFKQASNDGDLWWQIRALQELGWDDALNEFLLKNADAIEKGGDIRMKSMVAAAKGQYDRSIELEKQLASLARDTD